MDHTSTPTSIGLIPVAKTLDRSTVPAVISPAFAAMARTPKTRTAVPTISVTRFAPGERISGPVANTPSFASASSVAAQWGR